MFAIASLCLPGAFLSPLLCVLSFLNFKLCVSYRHCKDGKTQSVEAERHGLKVNFCKQ